MRDMFTRKLQDIVWNFMGNGSELEDFDEVISGFVLFRSFKIP